MSIDLAWLKHFIEIENSLFDFNKISAQFYEEIYTVNDQRRLLPSVLRCTKCSKLIEKRKRKSHQLVWLIQIYYING